jgi:hypothetical protein
MTYGGSVVKTGSSALFVLMFVAAAAACGGAAPTSTTASSETATQALAPSVGLVTSGPSASSASFAQLLGSARTGEYKVTYKMAAGGEQSWYSKPPKTRYDFGSTVSGQTSLVSIYSLPDGTYMCFGGTGVAAQCIGMTGLDTALQQNPAALYQQAVFQHPEQFTAVLVESRQIAGQQAQCFDVKSAVAIAILTDGRFCYSSQGVLLLQRYGAGAGAYDMEATSMSTTVPDSDFTLPAKPTVIGKP